MPACRVLWCVVSITSLRLFPSNTIFLVGKKYVLIKVQKNWKTSRKVVMLELWSVELFGSVTAMWAGVGCMLALRCKLKGSR